MKEFLSKYIFSKYSWFLSLLFSSQIVLSQLFPVQVNTLITAPYLTTLSSYSTTTNEKFIVNLFTNDLTIANRQIQLKLYIEGNGLQAVSTPVIYGYSPLYVNGGESLRLTNVDLAPYFQLQNLQGIHATQYSNPLPQGLYRFCIEVYDYNTQIKISQKSCAMAYFVVNDPPFLNLPANHENLSAQNPQNIMFTWAPRHLNASNIEYEFALVELQDKQAPSNYSFFIAQPLFQTTTSNTALLYGPGEPQLLQGKKYAWRIRAVTQPGFGENASFKNEGYSEIFDFTYNGNCVKPEFTLAEVLTPSQTKITWQPNPDHTGYLVQYRKKETQTWFEIQSTTAETQLYDLEPQATYEFKVGGYCIGDLLTFSNTNEFTQPSTTNTAIHCGIQPEIDLSNQTLFNGDLVDGQVFKAGDFAIHVLEATGSGSYSGKGWTQVPYLNNVHIAVIFENIKLNTSMQLLQGEVMAVYDPDWANILDINEVVDHAEDYLDAFQESNDVHNYSVDFVIGDASNITLINNQIVIVDTKTGNTGATFDHDPGETTTITDSQGNVYTVDPNGKVTQQGEGIGIPNTSNTENLNGQGEITQLSDAGVKVIFKRSTQSTYADDNGPASTAPNTIKAFYKVIKDGQGNDYPLYYKAIANKEDGIKSFDYVTAEITITDKNIAEENIIFNKKGIKIEVTSTTTQGDKIIKELKIPVFTTVGTEELLALLQNGTEKQKVVGAMKVVPIKDVGEVNVTLVPVNGVSITEDAIQQIKQIYQGTGVTLRITKSADYTTPTTTLACGDSGWLANYTDGQKAFINQYRQTHPPSDKEYYIFVTQGITPSRPISGFMPLHRKFGFVFTEQTTGEEVKAGMGIATTIAHELGHGVFELEHPWEKYNYNKGQGETNWLMDYASGTVLPYSDWQTISHPKTKLYLFQEDSEGEFPAWYVITLFKKLKHARQTNTVYNFQSQVKGETRILSNVNLNGDYFTKIHFQILPNTKQVDVTKIKEYKKTNSDGATLSGIEIDSQIIITVAKEELPRLKEYFESKKPENFILFVNGFVPTKSANIDKVWEFDKIDYWNAIDDLFIQRINKSSHVVYADGNKSISTSNHVNECTFIKSFTSCSKNVPLIPLSPNYPYMTSAPCTDVLPIPHHNTIPNKTGFEQREAMGKAAGIDFVTKLKNGTISSSKTIKDKKMVLNGVVDIVAHSMGFAYSLGMIEVLQKEEIKIGNFYVLAPENACSGTKPKNIEGIWQYGSDEITTKDNPIEVQDGVAPQCAIQGTTKDNRVYIPIKERSKEKLGFLASHSCDNYDWIFNKTIIKKGDRGYVEPRN